MYEKNDVVYSFEMPDHCTAPFKKIEQSNFQPPKRNQNIIPLVKVSLLMLNIPLLSQLIGFTIWESESWKKTHKFLILVSIELCKQNIFKNSVKSSIFYFVLNLTWLLICYVSLKKKVINVLSPCFPLHTCQFIIPTSLFY